MTQETETDAWTRYWQANNLDSCIAGGGAVDERDVFDLWAAFLASLPSGVSIIDLAAGNGAVSVRLLKAAQKASMDVSIHAVDLAEINPGQFAGDQAKSGTNLKHSGGIDISEMPFPDKSFGAAVSQFGFEYADTGSAAIEMLRILKADGHFQLLIHHSESALVVPNLAKIPEIDLLVAPNGVIDRLYAFLKASEPDQGTAMAELEKAGQEIAARYTSGLPQITQEIFSAVHQLIERKDLGFSTRLNAAKDMTARLKAEQERMRQLGRAALRAEDIKALITTLESHGATSVSANDFRVGKDAALLGWLIQGQKT